MLGAGLPVQAGTGSSHRPKRARVLTSSENKRVRSGIDGQALNQLSYHGTGTIYDNDTIRYDQSTRGNKKRTVMHLKRYYYRDRR